MQIYGVFGNAAKFIQTSFLVVNCSKFAFSLGLVSRQFGAFHPSKMLRDRDLDLPTT